MRAVFNCADCSPFAQSLIQSDTEVAGPGADGKAATVGLVEVRDKNSFRDCAGIPLSL